MSRALNLLGMSGELIGSGILVVVGDLLLHVLLLWGCALGIMGSRVVQLNSLALEANLSGTSITVAIVGLLSTFACYGWCAVAPFSVCVFCASTHLA